MKHAAIPTSYRGIQMRSRLEARWAAMFDLLGWQWDYEPIDLLGWIPDFILYRYRVVSKPTIVHGTKYEVLRENPILVEVKPYQTTDHGAWEESVSKARRAARGIQAHLLFLGLSHDWGRGWFPQLGLICYSPEDRVSAALGVLQYGRASLTSGVELPFVRGDLVVDFRGYGDLSPAVIEQHRDFTLTDLVGLRVEDFSSLWNEAGNRTQWKGARATP